MRTDTAGAKLLNAHGSINLEADMVQLKLKRRALKVFVGALLAGLTATLAGCAMGRAPVSGVVLDKETGKPIKGVEVFVEASYYFAYPAESEQGGAFGRGVSDAKGVFHLSSAGLFKGIDKTGIPPMYLFVTLIWPRKIDGIEVRLYAKEYVTISVKAPVHLYGKRWSKNGVTVEKKLKGYVLTVKMTRATSEKTWIRKCDATILAAGYVPTEVGQRWVFNDLTGYLERWPHGEKAGGYILSLADTGIAMYEPFWNEPISDPVKLKKYLSTEQQILKWMKSKPVQRITKNPLYQKIWSDKLQIISDSIAQMEKQGAVTKDGGKDAN